MCQITTTNSRFKILDFGGGLNYFWVVAIHFCNLEAAHWCKLTKKQKTRTKFKDHLMT